MGDWAHRFGASPLMRMTASWSGPLGPTAYKFVARCCARRRAPPQIVVANPTRCALPWPSDRTRWRQETGEEAIDRKSPIQVRGSGPIQAHALEALVVKLV